MNKIAVTVAAVSFALAGFAPDLGQAAPRRVRTAHASCVHHKTNNGTAIGAVGGGVAGALVTHGLAGPLIGAGVGAVAGHQIAKHRARSRC